MSRLASLITIFLALVAIVFAADHSPVLTNSAIYDEIALQQSRNFFQQLLINQIVNVLPPNIRDGIDDAAALFGMKRSDFLLKCLKELQAFQTYSKIDFITAIQKTIKFIDTQLTDEQREGLENLETNGIEFAKLLFSNQLQAGQMNKLYDLLVKIVRQNINGTTFVLELPTLIDEILVQQQ